MDTFIVVMFKCFIGGAILGAVVGFGVKAESKLAEDFNEGLESFMGCGDTIGRSQ